MKAIRVEPTTMTKASYFTIAEVINAIVDLERVDRPQSEWCGGVNCSHIYFEGLLPGSKKWKDAFFYIVYGDL